MNIQASFEGITVKFILHEVKLWDLHIKLEYIFYL